MSARLDRLALPAGVALTLATLAVVFYYPVGSVLAQAVRRDGRLTLAPVVEVLTDPFYVDLIGFTAYQAALSTVASVALGLPGAYLLARYEFRGRETVRSLTIVPFVLPSIMVAVAFQAMFSRTGLLNDALALVGAGPLTLLRDHALAVIVLAHAFYNAPLVVRIVAAAWENVDARHVESARALGASPPRAVWDVVVPQLRPAILTGALLTFIFTFMSFPIVLALGGLQLATIEVWLYARVQDLALAEAAVIGTVETVLTLGLTYLYLRYEAQQTAFGSAGSSLVRRRLVTGWDSIRDPRRLGLLVYGLVTVVVFVGPLASLVVESVTTPAGQFTTDYYAFLLEQQSAATTGTTRPLPAILNSLTFAVGTLLVALPMGIVVSLVATRGGRGSRLAEAGLTAPLAVSGIVVGLGLLQTLVFGTDLFGRRVTATGPVAIVLAHAVAAYPFVSRNVTPALGGLDPRLPEVARSLGASRLRTLVDVELPLVAAALVAGAAFAFAISIGEFDSTVLLAEGVDSYTMPVALERYSENRSLGPNLGPATAMGTVLLLVTAGSFVVIDRVGGRWQP